ncbi:MAG: class I SAM-dependent methyltransferase, partial [Candidatus Hodarchaeales archaeon]
MTENNKLLLSEEEQQILDTILSLELAPLADKEEEDEKTKKGDNLVPTLDNIRKRGLLIQKISPGEKKWIKGWRTQLNLLITKEMIQKVNIEDKNPVYSLTEIGRPHAIQRRRERIGRYFSDFHIRSDQSKTYSSFCNQVFGKDLNQANLMDMVQLDKLLQVLNLHSENRVLDLACGVGRIAEYISDTTQAHVLGIDMATTAIKRAQ